MVRAITGRDLRKIKKIHEEFYLNEFTLPNFKKHFINSFAITDPKGSIISIGGIRPILEVVAVTDKNKSTRDRVNALNEMLVISAHIAKHDNFDEFHCFVQDEVWLNQLKKKGFVETKGKSLVFKI